MNELKSYEKDGGYEDEKGCHWQNLGDFLQGSVLNFCCCGMPDENLVLIHDLLVMYQAQFEAGKNVSYENWSKFFEANQERLKQFVHEHWQQFIYFFWYVMSQKEIMEHGGSVPGWIADDNFMNALKKWKAEYDLSNV